MHVQGRLLEAVAAGDLRRVNKLLVAGANVNERDRYGSTPLMYAIRAGQQPFVQVLLGAGASITATNVQLNNALHLAFNRNLEEVMRHLVSLPDARLCLDMRNAEGKRPAMVPMCTHTGCARFDKSAV